MSKKQLSPQTSIAVSLLLMFGILVADVANVHTLTAAEAAQARDGRRLPLAAGTVFGGRIEAIDVLVNGVVTSGVFLGSVTVVDSVVVGGGGGAQMSTGIYPSDGFQVNGIYPSDGYTVQGASQAGGIYPSDGYSVGGIYPSDGLTSQGTQLVGGSVVGSDVRVVDGVITGQNLRVVGTIVQGGTVLDTGGATAPEN